MSVRVITHWLAFAVYVALFLTLPLALLWEAAGLICGIILTISFLVALRFRGAERIARRIEVSELTLAEAPQLHAMVREYCRRLQLVPPRLGIIETSAINLAAFGFRREHTWLVVTRGAIERLKRDELSALVGRELSYLWHGDVFGETWLAQFLATLDRLVSPTHTVVGKRNYPFRLFVRQILLYPLTLVPAYLLRGSSDPLRLDVDSARVTRKPFALAEALRRADATMQRTSFRVPFSARHLFLLSPPAQDPLARLFFGHEELSRRLENLETSLTRVVSLT